MKILGVGQGILYHSLSFVSPIQSLVAAIMRWRILKIRILRVAQRFLLILLTLFWFLISFRGARAKGRASLLLKKQKVAAFLSSPTFSPFKRLVT